MSKVSKQDRFSREDMQMARDIGTSGPASLVSREMAVIIPR